MSADKKVFFEFLASQREWEKQCRINVDAIGELPVAFRSTDSRAWTFPAQLLATLQGYDNRVETKAKNDAYPKLVDGAVFCTPPKDKLEFGGKSSPEHAWNAFSLPTPSCLDVLPEGSLLLSFKVRLQTPWYSRDDISFYPTENMLRRHKVFDAPYLAASSIKGLLRWGYAMAHGGNDEDDVAGQLFGEDDLDDVAMQTILHRDRRKDDEHVGLQGALYCYPLFWEGSIGLEVINPQDRQTGAGTNPIKYEVVKPGATGMLVFLLVNMPGRRPVATLLPHLLQALDYLFSFGGLSAKSSAGWGMVEIVQCNAAMPGLALPKPPLIAAKEAEEKARKEAEAKQAQEKAATALAAKAEAVKALTDKNGKPKPWDDAVYTNALVGALIGKEKDKIPRMRKKELAKLQQMVAEALQQASAAPAEATVAPAEVPAAPQTAQTATPETAWLWGSKGIADFSEFRRILSEALANKEHK